MQSAEQTVVDGFMRELDEIEKRVPMLGSYARTDPKIVEYEQAGILFRMVTFHVESSVWYAPEVKEWSMVHMRSADYVRPDDVIFDLGCNAGFYSVWFALQATRGHVHAFDPYPWNAASTRAQARLNGLSNVTAHAVGIGPKRAVLRVPATASKTFNVEDHRNVPDIDLEIATLKSYQGLRPTFLKIDIEGAEHQLGGAIVRSGAVRGYLELHSPFIEAAGGRPAKVLEELAQGGYAISWDAPGKLMWTKGGETRDTGYYFERRERSRRGLWWLFSR